MSKENPLPKNVFYDINKLPKEFGILVFPISIARVDHGKGQNAEQCMEYVKIFSPSKVSEPKIGLNMIYGDFLYLNSIEPAITLKNKFMGMVLGHRNSFQKLLTQEWNRFQIQHAFAYEVWNQLYLNYGGDFKSDYERFRQDSLKDEKFIQYLKDDAQFCGRELTQEQISFFLEEHFMFYLLSKKQITLPNEYVQNRERWILWCYPGRPLKGQAYVYQKNPLNLEAPENPYENCTYDLEAKKIIDFTRIDLATYNYKYE